MSATPSATPLEPASGPPRSTRSIDFDEHGQPFSPLYGDVYKSRSGAIAEAHAVFVRGCRLADRWAGRRDYTIVELGFGLGVNFLATLTEWRSQQSRPRRLHYVSVEAHPADPGDLTRALDALAIRGPDATRLLEHWPLATPGLHRLRFADGAVTLTLAFGEAQQIVARLALAADSFYLDGFAPERNPRMWTPALFRLLARLARPEASVATYSAAAAVRAALADAGFEVKLVPGHAGKRERIDASYRPRWRTFAAPLPAPEWPERSALVIGGGIGGCATAAALARRGWRVALIERRARLATEGSGQPLIADHLHVSPDDNRLARLTRAALLIGRNGDAIGKLQLARNPAEAVRQRHIVETLGYPTGFLRALDAGQASDVAGLRLSQGGLWLPMCGVAEPAAFCAQALADGGAGIELLHRSVVARIELRGRIWHALDARGDTIGSGAVAILANAGDALRLAGMDESLLRRVRGQTTLLESGVLQGLRCVIGGDAYACPMPSGEALVGSTFDDGEDLEPRRDADESNLRRLARMLAPGTFVPESALARAGSASAGLRYTAPDRLPLIGAMPDEDAVRAQAAELTRNDRLPLPRRDGLYGAFAFGSRGLLWAGLGAELLAGTIDGEPAPIESDLLAAIDPARFLRRRLRTRRLR